MRRVSPLTTVEEVRNEVIEYGVGHPVVRRLADDEAFLLTVSEQYDDYVKESEGNPNWSLWQYVRDKIENILNVEG